MLYFKTHDGAIGGWRTNSPLPPVRLVEELQLDDWELRLVCKLLPGEIRGEGKIARFSGQRAQMVWDALRKAGGRWSIGRRN